MTRKEPSERPKPVGALEQLESLVSQRSNASLRWKLIKFNTGRVSRFFVGISCIVHEGIMASRRITGEPLFIALD